MTASARAFELKSSDRRAGADARPSALRCASGVAALAYFAGACRAAPPQAPESAPSPHMEVRAITFRGEPLAGARIELATRTVGTGDLDLDAAAPATGGERREATADSDGVVRFPAPSGVFHLRAVHGALGADGWFAPSSPAPTVGRRTLVLRPYLKIAVRRRNGHPAAGVVVKELRDGRAPIEVGRTGPDGDLLAPYDDPQSPRTFVPWFVGASEQDALPSASDGALLLPPMRRVIVHAVDADGRPLTDAGEVGLQEAWVRKARSERANARAADDLGVFARAPLREGRAEFPYVAASADLAAVVTTRGDDGVRGEVAIPPSAEGAVDAATAVCDDGPPTLVARFVDAEGRPLGGVAPELLLRRRGAHDAAPVHGVATLAADAEGRMRRTLRRSVAFADGDVWRFRLGARGLQGAAVARAPMRGVCDLGDVTLAPPAPLAAGAVVDTARAPVAGAVVRVLAERDGRLAVVASATTDADGRFAAFDDDDRAPDDAFRLDARLRSDLYARELVSVARGANDVRVDLVEPGSLAGEIVLDPAAFPDASRTLELDVRFVNEFARIDDPERAWPATPVVPTSRGAFVFPRLRAGVGRLVATLPRHDEPLATVDDVRVLPGPPTRDPRCAPLDVTSAFVRRVVTVLDPAGRPVPDAAVVVRPGWSAFLTGRDGRADVVHPPWATRASVSAPGFEETAFELTGDFATTLVPIDEAVVVVTATGAPRRRRGPRPHVRLVTVDPALRRRIERSERPSARALIAADEVRGELRAELTTKSPGLYDVVPYFPARRGGEADIFGAVRVEIPPGVVRLEVRLDLDPDDVDAALRRAR